MSDRMSNPKEVLRNMGELYGVALRKGDRIEQDRLAKQIEAIVTIWLEQEEADATHNHA